MHALDVLALSARGRAYQRGARLRFWAMAIVCGIILLASVVRLTVGDAIFSPYAFSSMGLTSTTQLVRWTGDSWSSVELPRGCECLYPSFTTDNTGMLWLNDLPRGIYPYRDGAWGSSYIRFDDDDAPSVVAIDGDDVWGALYPELIRYDGQTWTRITSPLPEDDYVLDIAINGDTVVLLGYLSIAVRQGEEWTTTPLTQALPGIVNEENFFSDEVYPQLIAAPDGSFWLSFYGVYHSVDGVTWTLVTPIIGEDLYSTVLLNADSQGVWLARDRGVEHITADGEQLAQFTAEDIGFGEDEWVMSGSMSDESGVVSTILTLYVYDGETWQVSPIAEEQQAYVTMVALDNDGTALASAFVMPIAYQNPDTAGMFLMSGMVSPVLTSLATIITLSALFILPVADILFRYIPKYLSDRTRWIEMQRVLDAMGVARPQKTLVAYNLVVGFFGALSNGIWILLVTGGSMVLFSGLTAPAGAIPNSTLLYSEFADEGVIDSDAQEAAVVAGLMSSPLFANGMSPLLGVMAVVGYLLARLLQGGIQFGNRTTEQILRWILEGKYDEALKSTAAPGADGEPVISQPYLHVYALYAAGRHDEAELYVRKFLPEWRLNDPLGESTLLRILSVILRERGEYDESLRYQKASTMIRPDDPIAYAVLAATMAYAERDPVLALYSITEGEVFLTHDRLTSGFNAKLQKANEAEFRAILAWMLARDGQHAAAEAAMNQAMFLVPPEFPVFGASIHLMSGMARLATGDRDGARKHFETALRLDPNGGEGRNAREALEKLDGQASESSNAT